MILVNCGDFLGLIFHFTPASAEKNEANGRSIVLSLPAGKDITGLSPKLPRPISSL